MAVTDQKGIYLTYDQTWSNDNRIDAELRDYTTGAPISTNNFYCCIVLEVLEQECEMEKMFGPGPVSLLEHPQMLGNFNIIRQ